MCAPVRAPSVRLLLSRRAPSVPLVGALELPDFIGRLFHGCTPCDQQERRGGTKPVPARDSHRLQASGVLHKYWRHCYAHGYNSTRLQSTFLAGHTGAATLVAAGGAVGLWRSRAPALVMGSYLSRLGFVRTASSANVKSGASMKEIKCGQLVGSLDCGTTSVRFIVFDEQANIIAEHQLEFPQYYPHPGWHEHDPLEIQDAAEQCIRCACEKLEQSGWAKSSIKVIGITNQRETAVAWDRKTGKPLCRAIVWDDARTKGTVAHFQHRLRTEGIEVSPGVTKKANEGVEALRELTGLPLSTYFSAIKLCWMIDNYPDVRKAHESDNLCFGTVDSWLVYNLTGGSGNNLHITEPTNASRTLLLDLRTLTWSPALLRFFGLRQSILPKLVSSSEVYGAVASGPLEGVRIAGLVGDQQGALVGNKCLSVGEAKCTYGTGAFLLFNTGMDIVKSEHGLLTTVAYQAGPDAKPLYALEGSIAVSGSAIKWLRDGIGLIKSATDVNTLAAKVDATEGVYFVTAFSGLLAPYWDPGAGGLLIGLSQYTNPSHIARATIEANAFQTRAVIESMLLDSKPASTFPEEEPNSKSTNNTSYPATALRELKVDGGVTNGDLCMQILADICGFSVVRPAMRESTALGSAILAGAAVGMYGWDLTRPETLTKVNVNGGTTFMPRMSEEKREELWKGWTRAVERSKGWDEAPQKD